MGLTFESRDLVPVKKTRSPRRKPARLPKIYRHKELHSVNNLTELESVVFPVSRQELNLAHIGFQHCVAVILC
jgi:hypothetical protein